MRDFEISMQLDIKYFNSFMKELKFKTTNFSPVWRTYRGYIRKEIDAQYKGEYDPQGKPWEPLKPSTLLRKRTNFKLRETLQMYKSLKFRINNKSMWWVIDDEKYKFHHRGTKKMVARVILGDNQRRRAVLNKEIVQYIKTKRAGRKRK